MNIHTAYSPLGWLDYDKRSGVSLPIRSLRAYKSEMRADDAVSKRCIHHSAVWVLPYVAVFTSTVHVLSGTPLTTLDYIT